MKPNCELVKPIEGENTAECDSPRRGRYLVWSRQGRYWYRSDHCPAGAVDSYFRSSADVHEYEQKEGLTGDELACSDDRRWVDELVLVYHPNQDVCPRIEARDTDPDWDQRCEDTVRRRYGLFRYGVWPLRDHTEAVERWGKAHAAKMAAMFPSDDFEDEDEVIDY